MRSSDDDSTLKNIVNEQILPYQQLIEAGSYACQGCRSTAVHFSSHLLSMAYGDVNSNKS
jgi:hypothetical protein